MIRIFRGREIGGVAQLGFQLLAGIILQSLFSSDIVGLASMRSEVGDPDYLFGPILHNVN